MSDWSEAEQTALEGALRLFPASLPKEERWDQIAAHVGRPVKECVARFKKVVAEIAAKKAAAPPAPPAGPTRVAVQPTAKVNPPPARPTPAALPARPTPAAPPVSVVNANAPAFIPAVARALAAKAPALAAAGAGSSTQAKAPTNAPRYAKCSPNHNLAEPARGVPIQNLRARDSYCFNSPCAVPKAHPHVMMTHTHENQNLAEPARGVPIKPL